MTVAELIKKLEALPPAFEVHMNTASDWAYIDIKGVEANDRTKVVTLKSRWVL